MGSNQRSYIYYVSTFHTHLYVDDTALGQVGVLYLVLRGTTNRLCYDPSGYVLIVGQLLFNLSHSRAISHEFWILQLLRPHSNHWISAEQGVGGLSCLEKNLPGVGVFCQSTCLLRPMCTLLSTDNCSIPLMLSYQHSAEHGWVQPFYQGSTLKGFKTCTHWVPQKIFRSNRPAFRQLQTHTHILTHT